MSMSLLPSKAMASARDVSPCSASPGCGLCCRNSAVAAGWEGYCCPWNASSMITITDFQVDRSWISHGNVQCLHFNAFLCCLCACYPLPFCLEAGRTQVSTCRAALRQREQLAWTLLCRSTTQIRVVISFPLFCWLNKSVCLNVTVIEVPLYGLQCLQGQNHDGDQLSCLRCALQTLSTNSGFSPWPPPSACHFRLHSAWCQMI